MTDSQDVPMPPTQPQSGATPSTPTPPTGQTTEPQPASTPETPTSSPSPEWRAGDDAPPWAKGKSAEEVLGIASQMYGTLEKFNQTGNLAQPPQSQQVPQAAPQYPTQPPVAHQLAELAGDDYVTGGQVQQWAAGQMNQINQQNQAQFAGYAQQLAGIAKSQVRGRHQDVFDRYGPEIEMQISQIAPEQQTVDNLELVVKLVKGAHVDELVEIAMRERGAVNAEPTLRSTGGETAGAEITTPENTMEDERVPDGWRKRAQAAGIDDSTVDEWCALQGITKRQFYEDFQRDSITAPEA